MRKYDMEYNKQEEIEIIDQIEIKPLGYKQIHNKTANFNP